MLEPTKTEHSYSLQTRYTCGDQPNHLEKKDLLLVETKRLKLECLNFDSKIHRLYNCGRVKMYGRNTYGNLYFDLLLLLLFAVHLGTPLDSSQLQIHKLGKRVFRKSRKNKKEVFYKNPGSDSKYSWKLDLFG